MGVKSMVPFVGPEYITAPNIEGTQKGTIMLTIIHMALQVCTWGMLSEPVIWSRVPGA